jgi:hypothetical protein
MHADEGDIMTTPNGPEDPYREPQQPQDPYPNQQQPPAYPGGAPQYPAQPGDAPQYPGQPGGYQYGAPTAAPEPPKNILTAVKLMYVGAGLSAVGLLIGLFTLGDLKDQLAEDNPGFTQSEIDAAYSIGIVTTVVFVGAAVGLWVWMAQKNKQGRSWARVVATVLGGLNIVFTLFSLSSSTGIGTVFNLAGIVLAGVILWMLYRPESTAYYNAVKASQRPY